MKSEEFLVFEFVIKFIELLLNFILIGDFFVSFLIFRSDFRRFNLLRFTISLTDRLDLIKDILVIIKLFIGHQLISLIVSHLFSILKILQWLFLWILCLSLIIQLLINKRIKRQDLIQVHVETETIFFCLWVDKWGQFFLINNLLDILLIQLRKFRIRERVYVPFLNRYNS